MAYPQEASAGAPRTFAVEHDGLSIAALDWGGASGAHPLLLLHPNGFCAGLFDPIARRLAAAGAFRPIGAQAKLRLTPRELSILQSVERGESVKQTARSLGIAMKTVENLQSRMFRKLGARNRAHAVTIAHRLGLLEEVNA